VSVRQLRSRQEEVLEEHRERALSFVLAIDREIDALPNSHFDGELALLRAGRALLGEPDAIVVSALLFTAARDVWRNGETWASAAARESAAAALARQVAARPPACEPDDLELLVEIALAHRTTLSGGEAVWFTLDLLEPIVRLAERHCADHPVEPVREALGRLLEGLETTHGPRELTARLARRLHALLAGAPDDRFRTRLLELSRDREAVTTLLAHLEQAERPAAEWDRRCRELLNAIQGGDGLVAELLRTALEAGEGPLENTRNAALIAGAARAAGLVGTEPSLLGAVAERASRRERRGAAIATACIDALAAMGAVHELERLRGAITDGAVQEQLAQALETVAR
jgi:hypothetical protein